jgi:glycerophosphoryl diester phosphodiesterase
MEKLFIYRIKNLISGKMWKLLLMEMLLGVVSAYLVLPVISNGFEMVVEASAYASITKENYFKVIVSPAGIVFLLVLMFLLMLLMLLNITMIVTFFDEGCRTSRKGIIGYLIQIEKNFLRFVFSKKLLRIFYMIPAGIAVYMPGLIMLFHSNSMLKYLKIILCRNMDVHIFYGGIIFIYIIALLIFAFKFPYISLMILDEANPSMAKQMSRERMGRKIHRFINLVIWGIIVTAACVLIYVAVIMAAIFIVKLFSIKQSYLILFYGVFDTLNTALIVITAIICGIANISAVIEMSRDFEVKSYASDKTLEKKSQIFISTIFVIISVIAIFFSVRIFVKGDTIWNQRLGETTVTAHRGASTDAPENTLEALSLAIDEGADYVEIDVRLTADGQVVLMHDASTDRTSNENMLISDSTYDQLCQLDIGSWFSEAYAGTQIATLQEAIELCKGKVLMNIEIKPVNGSGELEDTVAEIITEYNMESQCVVTSFNEHSLLRVKAFNPDIVTGYIYTVGYDNDRDYEAMDVLSIDSRYLSKALVTGAHEKGIRVFAWTVNDKSEMRRMIALGVDSIITDRPVLAQQIIYEKAGGGLNDIWKFILNYYS